MFFVLHHRRLSVTTGYSFPDARSSECKHTAGQPYYALSLRVRDPQSVQYTVPYTVKSKTEKLKNLEKFRKKSGLFSVLCVPRRRFRFPLYGMILYGVLYTGVGLNSSESWWYIGHKLKWCVVCGNVVYDIRAHPMRKVLSAAARPTPYDDDDVRHAAGGDLSVAC